MVSPMSKYKIAKHVHCPRRTTRCLLPANGATLACPVVAPKPPLHPAQLPHPVASKCWTKTASEILCHAWTTTLGIGNAQIDS
jgi:hypothetical protein